MYRGQHYYNTIMDIIECYIDKVKPHINMYSSDSLINLGINPPFRTYKIHNVNPIPKRNSLLNKLKNLI